MNRLDFVIFGATGYTGQYVMEEMLRVSQNDAALRWGIAGRNAEKLQNCLDDATKHAGINVPWKVPIIICDVSKPDSIEEMAQKAKVVLNCVGPYRFHGETVVKACIKHETHHLDISGEPQYLESMQLEYGKEAEAKGVYVVGACGFDSIPAEVGTMYLAQEFKGDLNDVDCFIRIDSGSKGMTVHYGTWESAIYGFAHRNELSTIRRKLFPERMPKPEFPQKFRPGISYSKEVQSWCVPFPGSDRSVVNRSQRFLFERKDKRPIQFMPYIQCASLLHTFMLGIFGLIFGILASLKCGRYLLLKFPRLFSFGKFSHEGATREQVSECSFKMTFVGHGWQTAAKPQATKPDKTMVAKISAPEPGYITCSICLIQAGLTILQESKNMPGNGGVFAPGAAFWDTTLVKRLQSRGIDFQLVTPQS